MIDPRVTKLAEILCNYSTELSSKDNLLIHAFDMPADVVSEVARVAQKTGARVFVRTESHLIRRQIILGSTELSAATQNDIEFHEMKQMTAYIALRGSKNIYETSDVPSEKMTPWQAANRPTIEQRTKKTKWVVVRWPSSSMAQTASMSTPAFEDFYFDVCLVDGKKLAEASKPLKKLMEKTDHVHITGPGTDLQFSIKDIPVIPSSGKHNIPDGECYTAQVKESMQGVIQYNTSTIYQGSEFSNIKFVIKNGKIVEATADQNNEKLNAILDTDPGARYFGEWSIAYNPHVLYPMKDTLFDEKIAGSFHLTPGQAYEEAYNGNESSIHWDIVCIQRSEYGGGEIWFDGKLIRKDGLFVLPELAGLNPNKLG